MPFVLEMLLDLLPSQILDDKGLPFEEMFFMYSSKGLRDLIGFINPSPPDGIPTLSHSSVDKVRAGHVLHSGLPFCIDSRNGCEHQGWGGKGLYGSECHSQT